MKAIMVMFDSLNKHFLSSYGCDWIYTPNFNRLEKRSVVFDNCYAGSLPCMPARRELHTGRYNFLHRSWGPIEPFDDSMPEILKNNSVYTHLISDHFHYWEDGGSTYHGRYSSWEIVRGQQTDPWKGSVKQPEIPKSLNMYTTRFRCNDLINRNYINEEAEYPQAQVFNLGLEFIDKNKDNDNWFLQIETFDPHEPFVTPEKYKKLYAHEYNGPLFDYPSYKQIDETPDQVQHCKYEYAALVSMCDEYIGKVLDKMDELDLWKDTMLIVNTDHGFLLGEHKWWGKTVQPYYNEVINTPLLIWDPRSGKKDEHRKSLVQTIDLAPTLLELFGVNIPDDMQGKVLKDTINIDSKVREYALFGSFGGHVNCTDGRYVYMRAAKNSSNKPLYNYTLMPVHMRGFFSVDDFENAALVNSFSFTKGYSVIKTGAKTFQGADSSIFGSLLFDLENDPTQEKPINDKEIEERMIKALAGLMKENESPDDQFLRIGLDDYL